jgi:hypothetical protein
MHPLTHTHNITKQLYDGLFSNKEEEEVTFENFDNKQQLVKMFTEYTTRVLPVNGESQNQKKILVM